jgi:hypothetical protein
VSPSWRDRVSVFLGPGHVHLARYGKGWKPRPGLGLSLACGEANGTSWQPALEALARGLNNLQWQGADARVSVSNHFVRYALVPAARKLRGEAERAAAARHALRAIHGERADRWRVVLGDGGTSGAAVAAAIEPELVDGVAAALAAANLRAVAIEPFLATAFNLCRRSIDGRPAWLAVAEPGRVCVAYFDQTGWRGLRAERVRGRLEDELAAALERSRLADGVDAGAGRLLLVSRDEPQVEFAPGSGWSVERIRLEDSGVTPVAAQQ